MNTRSCAAARRRIAILATTAVAVGSLGLAGQASATITPTSTATDLSTAMNNGATVTTATLPTVPAAGAGGELPNAVSTTGLAGFPRNGLSYAILTSGDPLLADDPDDSGSSGFEYDGGTTIRGDSDYDVSVLRIDLTIPAGASCLSVDFRFLSEEYPEWVGTEFNDAFIAELDTSNWTTTSSDIVAPNNFATDENGDPVTINSTGNTSVHPVNAAGTTYDSATRRLQAATPVTTGAHQLYLSIFDQGDAILDATAFVDNLVVDNRTGAACASNATAIDTPPTTDPPVGSVSGGTASFTFGPPPAGGGFVCSLSFEGDTEAPFEPCTSPQTFSTAGSRSASPRSATGLEPGNYEFSVSAVNSDGDADNTPQVFPFTLAATPSPPPAATPPAAAAVATPVKKKCKKGFKLKKGKCKKKPKKKT